MRKSFLIKNIIVVNFINYIFFFKREIKKIGIKKIKRFLLVGIVNAISGYTLIILFYTLLNLNFYLSNFIGYLFGLMISFILNKKFVFNAQGKILAPFIKFIFSFFLSYFLNIFVFYICSEFINLNYYLALLIASCFYSISFFITCNYFTFKKSK